MHVRKVVLHDVIRGAVGYGSEAKWRLGLQRVGQTRVFQAGQVRKLLSGDHERGQVGRVDGQEDQGEGGPSIGHKSG